MVSVINLIFPANGNHLIEEKKVGIVKHSSGEFELHFPAAR